MIVILFTCAYLCGHVEVRRQLFGVSFLLPPCGFSGINLWLLGLVSSAFAHWAISLAQSLLFLYLLPGFAWQLPARGRYWVLFYRKSSCQGLLGCLYCYIVQNYRGVLPPLRSTVEFWVVTCAGQHYIGYGPPYGKGKHGVHLLVYILEEVKTSFRRLECNS